MAGETEAEVTRPLGIAEDPTISKFVDELIDRPTGELQDETVEVGEPIADGPIINSKPSVEVVLYPGKTPIKSRNRVYTPYDAGEVVPGMSVRVRKKGRSAPKPIQTRRSDLHEMHLLAREAAYADLFEKGVEIPVNEDLAKHTASVPYDGAEMDIEHGGFSTTVVTENRTNRDAGQVWHSLTPKERNGIVEKQIIATFQIPGYSAREKRTVAQRAVAAARRSLMFDQGISAREAAKRVKMGTAYRIIDTQAVDELAKRGKVTGVEFKTSTRVEVDAINPHAAIEVRRPRRIRERLAKIRKERRADADFKAGKEKEQGAEGPQSENDVASEIETNHQPTLNL